MSSTQSRVTDRDVIKAVRNAEDPFATCSDVAEQIGYTTEGARLRLMDLVDGNKLERAKIGASAVIYWDPSEIEDS
jgi:prophage antirepressor-like protein